MCLDGSSKGVSIVSAVYSSRYIASTPPNPAGIYMCIHVYTCIYIYDANYREGGREGGRSVLTNLDIYIYIYIQCACIHVYTCIYIYI